MEFQLLIQIWFLGSTTPQLEQQPVMASLLCIQVLVAQAGGSNPEGVCLQKLLLEVPTFLPS